MSDREAAADLGAILDAVRRGWWLLLGSVVLGGLSALAVIRYAPPVWTAHASVLVRDASPLPGALAEQLGGAGAGAAAALFGGALKSPVETNIALLESRELVGQVVDSLGLQVVITEPHGTAPGRIVQGLNVSGAFRPLKLRLEPGASGIYITGKGVDTLVPAGGTVRLPGGTLRVSEEALLPAAIEIFDREDAITRAGKGLSVTQTGGEVLGVAFRANDSLSAPAAANLLIAQFLLRRRGVDRGLSQRRLEFVSHQIDSVDAALNEALRAQRAFHESAQTVDPAVSAKTYLESLVRLREQRETLVMEERALSSLMEQLRNHTVQPRQLAAYPSFLKSPAINELLGKIGTLEAERVSLLARQRRDQDPAVLAVAGSIAKLETELEPLARTYDEAIGQQRSALDAEIATVNGKLAQLPTQVEQAFQHAREVERLSRTSLALNAQRVDLRLATIGEGGEARVVDVASPQWKRSFPSTILTLVLGLLAGLALGFALALMWAVRPLAPATLRAAPPAASLSP